MEVALRVSLIVWVEACLGCLVSQGGKGRLGGSPWEVWAIIG